MFSQVARAAICQQQVIQLLKQRSKLHSALIFDKGRMNTLEQHLLAHIYTLCDEETLALKPQVQYLVDSLNVLSSRALSGQAMIDYFLAAEGTEHQQAILLLCSLLPLNLTVEQPSQLLEQMLYQHGNLAELVQHFQIDWQAEELTAARKALLSNKIQATQPLVNFLYSDHDISDDELVQGYQHENSDIALASFVSGLSSQRHQQSANAALFNRFAKTDDITQKAQWLELAGLTGDQQWLEPCRVFCLEHPDFAFNILCHYQHITSLRLVIELMSVAQTASPAYQAWLVLTRQQLLMTPQLIDINNKHQAAGKQLFPNTKQAELYRQSLFTETKTADNATQNKILNGRLFSANTALKQLKPYQGEAIQRVLLISGVVDTKLTLFRQTLSAKVFSQLVQSKSTTANGVANVA